MLKIQRKKLLLATHVLMLGSGCATLGPALTSLALSFGQDLLAAASVNHAPRYAVQVEDLLASLASVATGLEVKPQLAAAGYQPPPAKYQTAMSNSGNDAGNDNGDYTQANGPNTGYADEGYSDEEYSDEGYADQEYSDQGYPDQEYSDQPAMGTATPGVSLHAALLVQRQGQVTLASVADGEVLRDGGANPVAGDKLKVQFRANCQCYVYVIAVDATGYVAQIFPDAAEGLYNPVTPQENYSTPGTGRWWALDEYKGTETLYFVVARQPRRDLEQALATLAGAPRQLNPKSYQPVMQPALLPATRGLVKVTANEPIQLSNNGNSAMIAVDQFTASLAGTDLAVTRWFRHQ